ncbi:cysteine peptidase family C39 domain-containing protein, partial [Klebsiella pneumoniae]|uniref:cysteine peptidase family C39 domain-containing protein n=1 Tax=Klebsiella pneumoniae TaxID=573 RepID=UPI002234B838
MNNKLFETIIAKLNFSLIKKTPVILQSESAECGIASLAMICGHYGLDIDLFNFRQRFGSPSQGASLLHLSKTAERAGLKNRALSLDLDEIKQLKLPCILHWGMNHYVVLTKVRKSRESANKQVMSSQADSLIKISRIWADFFPANTSNQP